MRRYDWIALGLLTVLTLIWAVVPPAGRPQDLDLQVQVRQVAPPQAGRGQELEATVRWQWRQRPWLTTGQWHNCITFAFDEVRWTQLLSGSSIGSVEPILAQYNEPRTGHCLLVGDADSGELKTTFVARPLTRESVPTPVFPLRVRFVHSAESQSGQAPVGWVRSLGGDWPVQ